MIFFFDVEWIAFLPELFLTCISNMILLYAVFYSSSFRHNFPIMVKNVSWLCIQVCFFVFLLIYSNVFEDVVIFNDFLIVDSFSNVMKLLVVVLNLILLLIVLVYNHSEKVNNFEFVALDLFACIGMFCLISSYDLISIFLALELQSFCFYVLCCLKRQSEFSVEAGLKYFILGAFSSAFFLFGCSLIYGFSGTTNLEKLSVFLNSFYESYFSYDIACIIGLFFVLIGLMFKLSLAPFHFWSPDVFEGSPLSVTALFSFVPKVAILGIFVKFFLSICYVFFVPFQKFILMCSVLSLFIGILSSLFQRRLKKFLAYSSISHFGFIFLGISCATFDAIFSSMFYLIVYMLSLVIIFSILLNVRLSKTNHKLKYLSDLSSIYILNNFVGLSLLIVFLSIAGIPPFVGFFSKFFVLFNVLNCDMIVVSIFGILISSFGCFYYIRLVKMMFFDTQNCDLIFLSFRKENSVVISFFTIFLFCFLLYPNLFVSFLCNNIFCLFL